MLSIQVMHGLPPARDPGNVPCLISFSKLFPCFRITWPAKYDNFPNRYIMANILFINLFNFQQCHKTRKSSLSIPSFSNTHSVIYFVCYPRDSSDLPQPLYRYFKCIQYWPFSFHHCPTFTPTKIQRKIIRLKIYWKSLCNDMTLWGRYSTCMAVGLPTAAMRIVTTCNVQHMRFGFDLKWMKLAVLPKKSDSQCFPHCSIVTWCKCRLEFEKIVLVDLVHDTLYA